MRYIHPRLILILILITAARTAGTHMTKSVFESTHFMYFSVLKNMTFGVAAHFFSNTGRNYMYITVNLYNYID